MVDFSRLNKEGPSGDRPNKKDVFGLSLSTQSTGTSFYYNDRKTSLDGLNEGQSIMVSGIIRYLKGELDLKYFLVQGPGGTGKSFAINRALKGLEPSAVIGAAASHSAKNTLKDFLGDRYQVVTVASLLGKSITYNERGEEILVSSTGAKKTNLPIMRHKVIIIDEGSMIDDEVAAEIIEICNVYNKKLIVLGDYCQVPPVKQKDDSMFFDFIATELTESMRFTGPILNLANAVRAEIVSIRSGDFADLRVVTIYSNRVSCLDEKGSGYIFLNSISTVIKAAVKRFKKGNGTGYVRILAYRNKTIDKLNILIRKELYGEDSLQFEHGESLIASRAYTVNKEQIITNGELLQVETAEDVIGPYDVACKRLTFIDRTFSAPVYVVAREGEDLYNKILTSLEKDGNRGTGGGWAAFYNFKNSFAYFNYSYVTSIHKAQGNSISHVFIIEEDIYTNRATQLKEKLQLLYVAISRASFRAYIFNKDQKAYNGNLSSDLLLLDKN